MSLGGRVAARSAWLFVRMVAVTLRWSWTVPPHSLEIVRRAQPVIFAVWHNRQLLAPELYRRYFRSSKPLRRLASIASASRDGAIAARFLELSDTAAVRGSSSRRGARALAELIELARQGLDLAVTPDGPRGPRYEVKPGIIALAQHTGIPVIPICYHMSLKRVLRSWDGFQIPLPFGRCDIEAGEPLSVPSDLDENARSDLARELQNRLVRITRD